MPDPNRSIRAREDSTNLRYSAEPVALHRVQTKPNGKIPTLFTFICDHKQCVCVTWQYALSCHNSTAWKGAAAAPRKAKVTFESDKDGYLSPTEEANQKPGLCHVIVGRGRLPCICTTVGVDFCVIKSPGDGPIFSLVWQKWPTRDWLLGHVVKCRGQGLICMPKFSDAWFCQRSNSQPIVIFYPCQTKHITKVWIEVC